MLPGRTAVVEAAEAIGFALLRPEGLDPMRASSRGLGEAHPRRARRPAGRATGVPRRHGHGGRRRRSAGGVRRLPCPCPRCVRRAQPAPRPARGRLCLRTEKGASRHRWRSWRRGCPRGRACGRSPTFPVQELPGALARPSPPSAPSSFRELSSFRARWIPRARPLRRARRHRRGHRRPRDARGESAGSRAPGLRRGRSPLCRFRRPDQRAATGCRAARAWRPGPGARGSPRSRELLGKSL